MFGLYRCERCGSVGSIEFDMCQVCLHDYAHPDNLPLLKDLPGDEGEIREKGATGKGMHEERKMMAGV